MQPKLPLSSQPDGRQIGLGTGETATIETGEVGAGVTFAEYSGGQAMSVEPGVSNVPSWRVFQQDNSGKGNIFLEFGDLGVDAKFIRVRLVKDASPTESGGMDGKPSR